MGYDKSDGTRKKVSDMLNTKETLIKVLEEYEPGRIIPLVFTP